MEFSGFVRTIDRYLDRRPCIVLRYMDPDSLTARGGWGPKLPPHASKQRSLRYGHKQPNCSYHDDNQILNT